MAETTFDPDKYLAQKTAATAAFNPDKYLAEKTGPQKEEPELMNFGPELYNTAHSVVSAPWAAVRGLIGKGVGTKTQGFLPGSAPDMDEIVDTVAPSLREMKTNFVDTDISYLPKEHQTPELQKYLNELAAKNEHSVAEAVSSSADQAGDFLSLAGVGGALSKGARGTEKVLGLLKNAGGDREAGKLISEAAAKLGIEATPGMKAGPGFIERLESSLSESPSYWGRKISNSLGNVYGSLKNSAQGLLADASPLTPYQTGEAVKSGITAKVGERLDPISAVFDEVAESTKHIPVGDRSKKAITRNIENLDTYKLTGGAGKPQQYVDMLSRVENADQVKTMMTLLNKDIMAATGAERDVLLGIKEKLATLEKNSIMRGAIQTAKESGGAMRQKTGSNVASDIIKDLKDARQGYRGLMSDIGGVSKDARIRSRGGPSGFLNEVENVPSERIQDKFFNPENNRQLTNLSEKFPEEFDLLRQGKLRDIQQMSQHGGNTSSARFLREVNKLNPEVQNMLFKENAGFLKDMETVQNSMPKNYNPSGTASQDMWNTKALWSNIQDIPRYALYKTLPGASDLANASFQQVSKTLQQVPKYAEMARNNAPVFNSMVKEFMRQNSGPSPTMEDPQPVSPGLLQMQRLGDNEESKGSNQQKQHPKNIRTRR